MFVGDWSLGQIHAIKFERDGATYKAKITTLLKGRPLNVTDLAVGPDGGLYFCTGGRGTDGGIYRIHWKGQAPAEATDLGQGIQQALASAAVSKRLGSPANRARARRNWATNGRPSFESRARRQAIEAGRTTASVDLMAFFGPAPTADTLIELTRDSDPAMRAKSSA